MKLIPSRRSLRWWLIILLLLPLIASPLWSWFQEWRREQLVRPVAARAAAKHGIPVSLVLAVIKQESRFRPQLKGGKGEYGLMQIMPAVAADWTKAHKREAFRSLDILFQPEQNLEVGCWHLARAVRRWRDAGYRDWVSLALAQYNAGATRVTEQKWAPPDKSGDALSRIDWKGVRSYVEKIRAYQEDYE
jgi:soluble lytic murein transglycosylase